MKPKAFFNQLDHDKMVAAIAAAEHHTSGEIRVFVSHRKVDDANDAAVRQFHKLGMHRTRLRNAVLIFVAPQSQNFAIIGDEAIHAKCGDPFWQQVAGEMGDRFRKAEHTAAIVHGIHAVGALLARHFPRGTDDRNELPDAVVED